MLAVRKILDIVTQSPVIPDQNVDECHIKKSGFNRKVEAALIYDSDELFLFI